MLLLGGVNWRGLLGGGRRRWDGGGRRNDDGCSGCMIVESAKIPRSDQRAFLLFVLRTLTISDGVMNYGLRNSIRRK
jgi:hypothetical protein